MTKASWNQAIENKINKRLYRKSTRAFTEYFSRKIFGKNKNFKEPGVVSSTLLTVSGVCVLITKMTIDRADVIGSRGIIHLLILLGEGGGEIKKTRKALSKSWGEFSTYFLKIKAAQCSVLVPQI